MDGGLIVTNQVSKIEDAIKNMEKAVDAIERLQNNAVNAAGSTEEKGNFSI